MVQFYIELVRFPPEKGDFRIYVNISLIQAHEEPYPSPPPLLGERHLYRTVEIIDIGTIEDIRDCFALIAAPERELSNKKNPDLPVYKDDGPTTRIVDFKEPES